VKFAKHDQCSSFDRLSTSATARTRSKLRAIRILIIDDHPLIREGLAAGIRQEPDMELCGEADSIDAALSGLEQAKPDVVIVDLTLKGGRGLELIKRIRARETKAKVLALSSNSEALYGERALRLGALGFVDMRQPKTSLVGAIRAVAAGRRYISEQLAQRLLEHAISGRGGEISTVDGLSDRELQVFECIGAGKSTRGIAEELHLSIHTIETYRENIRAKLSLKNGSELIQRAVHWRLENRPS
jgi:DNA-binding NarL/FixJ family response regulator